MTLSSPTHVPLPVSTHPSALPPSELNEQEKSEYDRVLDHFANPDYRLPGVPSEAGSLMEEECMWLSYECILRYIRNTKHDVAASIKRIEDTLKWRRDFGLYGTLTAELVEPEAVSGVQFLFGYDTCGRPAVYMSPGKQTTEESPRQLQYTVWILERAIDLMGPGVESLMLLTDYADKTASPNFTTIRTFLNILQTHYPERLGASLVAHLPWLLHKFLNLATSFAGAMNAKTIFNPVRDDQGLWRSAEARKKGVTGKPGELNAKLFELDQLVHDGWEGSQMFTYEHAIYWPALVEMCDTRRKDMTAVWRKLGGRIGIREWDVKVALSGVEKTEE